MYLSEYEQLGFFKSKKMKKFGNILQKVAPIALSFVPVVGWAGTAAMLASKALQARKQMVAAKDARKQEQEMMEAQVRQQAEMQNAMAMQNVQVPAAYVPPGAPQPFQFPRATPGGAPLMRPGSGVYQQPGGALSVGGMRVSPIMLGAAGAGILALVLLSRKK